MPTSDDEPTELPAVISRYQHAHDGGDTATALGCFTADATVVDDGATHVGTEQIRAWLDTTAAEFTYTRTLTGAELQPDGSWIVRNHLAGDFPGGTVDLSYRFEARDGSIAALHIAP